jgi:hypothetical protein
MKCFLLVTLISCANPTPVTSSNIPGLSENVVKGSIEYISLANLKQELTTLGYPPSKQIHNGFMCPIPTDLGEWKLSVQHFEEQNILYLALNDYLWLDQAESSQETVFTLTQLATRNHALLGAKLQLNPQNGAITISTEIPIGSNIEKIVLQRTLQRLIQLGTEEYPMLKASLGIDQY